MSSSCVLTTWICVTGMPTMMLWTITVCYALPSIYSGVISNGLAANSFSSFNREARKCTRLFIRFPHTGRSSMYPAITCLSTCRTSLCPVSFSI
ncbi:hypothetical protein AOQ84DRAFT_187861 [Glonium stellatum]|uniref:Uncharacterized protein n=1 Tax=Glonium stellatum TaxID=574774 RepID=A0A8E2JMB2_9PEZI|nr:hypothetical protein AOQ84DRAFT_187861 [Glonium stellatum]